MTPTDPPPFQEMDSSATSVDADSEHPLAPANGTVTDEDDGNGIVRSNSVGSQFVIEAAELRLPSVVTAVSRHVFVLERTRPCTGRNPCIKT